MNAFKKHFMMYGIIENSIYMDCIDQDIFRILSENIDVYFINQVRLFINSRDYNEN